MNAPAANHEQEPGEFGSLSPTINSPERCSTSLFRLICHTAEDAQLLGDAADKAASDETGGKTLKLWANRRGQNATESISLALLSMWLVGGITTGAIVHYFGRAWWVWPLSLAVVPFVTFVALQCYSFASALAAGALQQLGLTKPLHREATILLLSLLGLTALAVVALQWRQPLFVAAAIPWLLWAGLNFISWLILSIRGLIATLNEPSAPTNHHPDD
jgi:hypothetical protein